MWERFLQMASLFPAVVFSLMVHEFAHGLAADRLGDPTPRSVGRLTLNPLRHLDPVGTIMLFVAHIGWARPMPINPANFRNPRVGTLWVSLSGPMANMIAALGCGLLLRSAVPQFLTTCGAVTEAMRLMLAWGMTINLVLAAFNLLPVPPLDGSKVLMALLPRKLARACGCWEPLGPWLLLAIVLAGRSLIWKYIGPWIYFFGRLFAGWEVARFLNIC